jgi:hypothetical protein
VDAVIGNVCKLDKSSALALLIKEKIEFLKGKGYIHA